MPEAEEKMPENISSVHFFSEKQVKVLSLEWILDSWLSLRKSSDFGNQENNSWEKIYVPSTVS